MKSLTIVTTWGTKYWPLPVQEGLKSTAKNWPLHAKILLYPDDMSQQLDLPRTQYYDLCKEQPVLKEFIERNEDRLFKLGIEMTKEIGASWFLVKSSEEEKSTGRYRYEGDILDGISEYIKIINHIKKRDNS